MLRTSTTPPLSYLLTFLVLASGALLVRSASADAAGQPPVAAPASGSCFLLHEVGVGEVRRAPAEACRTRVAPQSTFKIPHALAAIDAGVVTGADSAFAYDGSPQSFDAWRRDHTLATAMRFSVVWWFQRVAEKLGAARERDYLQRFAYGNADPRAASPLFGWGDR